MEAKPLFIVCDKEKKKRGRIKGEEGKGEGRERVGFRHTMISQIGGLGIRSKNWSSSRCDQGRRGDDGGTPGKEIARSQKTRPGHW